MAELTSMSAWSYTPEVAPAATAALTRRTASTPADPGHAAPSTAPATKRSAEQVRGVLSGFRAGVERGRRDQADKHPTPEEES